MKYLFIGAHPDDIEYSCGGTLLRLAAEGHEVYLVIMTNGGAAEKSIKDDREAEQWKAYRYSKAKRLLILSFKDGAIKANARSIGKIASLIEEINPDVVVTHYPDDSHQDHRNVAAIVKSATRRRCSLAYFDSYSSINFKPNVFVDITSFVRKKKEMLRLFKSQVTKYNDRGIDFVEKSILISTLNGYECKSSFAEGFAIDTYIIKENEK